MGVEGRVGPAAMALQLQGKCLDQPKCGGILNSP